MMRILHIIDVKNPKGNGVALAVENYVIHENAFAEVAVYNLGADIITEQKLDVYRYKDFRNISALPNGFSKPDIVIFNEVYKAKYLELYKECIRMGIPYIIIPHGGLSKKAQCKKRIKKGIANLIFFNRFLKRAIAIQYLNIDERQESKRLPVCQIVHGNGVKKVVRRNLVNKNGPIVFIGRYSIYHKGIDLILDAVSMIYDYLKQNNLKIELYGRDSINSINDIKKIIAKKNVADVVKVNGPVYGYKKDNVLNKAGFFILASRFEGEPIGVIEALSYGVPCIVTRAASLGGLVEKYQCGIVTDPTAKQIANAIINATSCTMASSYSKSARRLVEEKFLWKRVAEETVLDYKKILNK